MSLKQQMIGLSGLDAIEKSELVATLRCVVLLLLVTLAVRGRTTFRLKERQANSE